MPIYRLLQNAAFGQEEIDRIVWAFKAAIVDLGIRDYAAPLAELTAKKIFKQAEEGERDPQRIRRIAVTEIRIALSVESPDAVHDQTGDAAPVSRKLVERRYREWLSNLKRVSG